MRSFLRLTTLVALLLMTAWAVPGCSSDDTDRGEDGQGASRAARWAAPWTRARWTAPWTKTRWAAPWTKARWSGAMDKGKMGGAMDKGKMEGAMDKGKM